MPELFERYFPIDFINTAKIAEIYNSKLPTKQGDAIEIYSLFYFFSLVLFFFSHSYISHKKKKHRPFKDIRIKKKNYSKNPNLVF